MRLHLFVASSRVGSSLYIMLRWCMVLVACGGADAVPAPHLVEETVQVSPTVCKPPHVVLYKTEDKEWCEQFCVDAKLAPSMKQFGDVNDGTCSKHGYPHYNHTENVPLYGAVDLYTSHSIAVLPGAAVRLGPSLEAKCKRLVPNLSFNGSLIWNATQMACTFSCFSGGPNNFPCMELPEAIEQLATKMGMSKDRRECNITFEEPVLIVDSCPEWKLTESLTKTRGMLNMLDIYTEDAIKLAEEALVKSTSRAILI